MDLIDREQAINALDELCERVCQYSKEQRAVMCGACPLGDAFDVIDNMPSAEKTGEWIDTIEHDGWSCSNCGGSITSRYGKYSYCPCCGARMVED